ncbi:hypothetical protein BD626DRAFT_548669 [Schizophyllum amplum]|uniref:Formyl transferase C-terminal domain-containing protein n=1 Tax=Schizophyllum amplum TaxID=97359 RepID=A0A550CBV7_9AGAR|nr:hypothetical protein BD626DRAFT_548669 [Auriculariopsis ampla]
MGRDEFSCAVFQHLYDAKDVWQQLHIATQPDERVGRRGSQLSVSPLKELGHSFDFKSWKVPAGSFHCTSSQSILIFTHLVTASFGRILPQSMLAQFTPHNCLNRTLMAGDQDTAVCVIEMMRKVDAGAIWGREQLASSVAQAEDVTAPRAPLIQAQDAMLDFHRMSAKDIVRLHRAIGHQRALIAGLPDRRTLQLHGLSVEAGAPASLASEPGTAVLYKPEKKLLVRCADGSVLGVRQAKMQDKALLGAVDWWNGARSLGMVTDKYVRLSRPAAV